ncbi:hypothetical protein GCM10008018_37130 [Paenibacillus marchantiophytorum]|uniref:Glycosyltransferase 2-like domain-containing protein n=1 Tax=Paenibacillus marchantiophytorum TaxID=1619310 RepID=A0ABQ1EV58_9BACL|nr:glycosyltransferase [Paenibacillus marchantiophytorum]GFZ87505.1 hypothetical protein GCM10008018_37130 [Paenibacillus marchantiophytorum]
MNQPTISLCMIVKDEEAQLASCLQSVKDWVTEMIIVDTGSTDRTKEICESFGAKVFDYTWNNHFAEARNFGLAQAKGDWILYLDADEEFEPLHDFALLTQLNQEQAAILTVHLINYIGDHPNEDEAFHIAHPRFFRNHLGLRFQYPIHETLNVEEIFPKEQLSDLMGHIPLKLLHRGYMPAITAHKKKYQRNMALLNQEANQASSNPWVEYHIASEYYRVQQYDKAFEYVNLSIVRFIQSGLMPPSLLYKLKYAILFSTGSIDGAWPGIDKAIALYPDYVDLHFYKGVIFYLKKWTSSALDVFYHCLSIGESTGQHLTLKGAGSFHAWYYIGLCWESLENNQKAVQAYQTALELSPTYTLAAEAIQLIQKKQSL